MCQCEIQKKLNVVSEKRTTSIFYSEDGGGAYLNALFDW